MTTDEVRDLILKGLPDAEVQVDDFGGGSGDHFQAVVKSPSFAGLSMVEQHRKVYATVQEYMADERIHALSLTTGTP